MRKITIYVEMARRKVAFHSNEDWDKINLWGLFSWGTVSSLLESGELLTTYTKANETIWVTPSKDCWEKNIKPLIENYTLYQLEKMAGW